MPDRPPLRTPDSSRRNKMIAAFGFSAFALTVALFYGWVLVHLRRSQDRIVARLDGVVHRLAAQQAAAAAATAEPVRVAQDFVLPTLDGRIVSLRDLLAAGMRTLLHFTDPKCGPCYEL